jgi:predicted transcriptional regulator
VRNEFSITIRLDKELRDVLVAIAADERSTISQVAKTAIFLYAKKLKKLK